MATAGKPDYYDQKGSVVTLAFRLVIGYGSIDIVLPCIKNCNPIFTPLPTSTDSVASVRQIPAAQSH